MKACKDCQERTPECHIGCEKYAAEVERQEEIRRKRATDHLCRQSDYDRGARMRRNAQRISRRRQGY